MVPGSALASGRLSSMARMAAARLTAELLPQLPDLRRSSGILLFDQLSSVDPLSRELGTVAVSLIASTRLSRSDR